MSLDIIFTERSNNKTTFENKCGCTVAVDFDDSQDKDYFINITHNLNIMAEHVPIGNTNLYKVLWHGDELEVPIVKGKQFEDYLYDGISYLIRYKPILLEYNPENGWGNYDSLLQFTKDCLALSIQHPNADVKFSR